MPYVHHHNCKVPLHLKACRALPHVQRLHSVCAGGWLHSLCLLQGDVTWRLDAPEELLSPRSRSAANAALRLAQGLSRGVQNLGSIFGDFGAFLVGKHTMSYLHMLQCCYNTQIVCEHKWHDIPVESPSLRS